MLSHKGSIREHSIFFFRIKTIINLPVLCCLLKNNLAKIVAWYQISRNYPIKVKNMSIFTEMFRNSLSWIFEIMKNIHPK